MALKKMYTKEQLFDMVKKLYEDDGITALGEEVDGGKQMPSVLLEKFKAATGRYPAVLGVDLACYGLQIPSMSVKQMEQAAEELSEFAHNGGIVTASSHFANPVRSEGENCRGHFGFEDKWEELLTEGTELNTIWKAELYLDARFLRLLGEKGVPVLWRPLHECNGGWFWFCVNQGDWEHSHFIPKELYTRAWKYLYNFYENELGLTNLLWVYAPNITPNRERNLYCYPGDEYVDIVGYDWYTEGKYEVDNDGKTHDVLASVGKPVAITEFGPAGDICANKEHEQTEDGYFNGRDLLALLDRLHADGRKTAYVMTWTWHWGIHSWKYADELMANEKVADLDRMAKLFDEMN